MYSKNKASATFTEEEAEYLLNSRLGRLATASASGQAHVVPVVYEFDGHYLYFGGWGLEKSLKFRNILKQSRVAFVVDDVETVEPWKPRGIEVRGLAEVVREKGKVYVRITPVHKVSWGLKRRKNGTD
ncbi:MAG: PPOX class F420-dependent oxidoreductase [Thaumarchaeota archaeon]|nr:PPOX class F420-dependent oxidoreductase [Nitrososphaerota archaeon]